MGWRPLRLQTESGPVAVVPPAAAIGSSPDGWPRAVALALDRDTSFVASLDDVIRSKEFLWRPMDVAALPLLRETRRRVRQIEGPVVLLLLHLGQLLIPRHT